MRRRRRCRCGRLLGRPTATPHAPRGNARSRAGRHHRPHAPANGRTAARPHALEVAATRTQVITANPSRATPPWRRCRRCRRGGLLGRPTATPHPRTRIPPFPGRPPPSADRDRNGHVIGPTAQEVPRPHTERVTKTVASGIARRTGSGKHGAVAEHPGPSRDGTGPHHSNRPGHAPSGNRPPPTTSLHESAQTDRRRHTGGTRTPRADPVTKPNPSHIA